MRKWLIGLIPFLLLLLVACADPDSADTDDEEGLSAEEVYLQSMDQLDTLDSAAFDMTLEQTIHIDGEEDVTTIADVTGEITEDPFAMHQNGSVTMESEMVGALEINVEMYAKDDVVYVYEDMFNNWVKGTMETLGDTGLEIGEEQSPFSHTEDLGPYIEDFSFEETNETYNFSLETNDEKFKELIIEQVQEELQMQMDENKISADMIDIEQLHYDFTIDKETYNMLSFMIDFEISMTDDDETATAKSIIDAKFSDFNTIEAIEIPEKALEEAVEPDDTFGF